MSGILGLYEFPGADYDRWKTTDDTPGPDPNRCDDCGHPDIERYCDCPCCHEPGDE